MATPILHIAQDPISVQPGAPRPGWSCAGGMLVSSSASWMDLRPTLQPCLQPCLRPFLLHTGPPGWTLTLVHHLLCLGLPMDHDTSLMCSDPARQHPSVRATRRTPASWGPGRFKFKSKTIQRFLLFSEFQKPGVLFDIFQKVKCM